MEFLETYPSPHEEPDPVNLKLPAAFQFLMPPRRYKVAYGGRGGGKSTSLARALIVKSMERRRRILCTREYQNSIADSVHRLIAGEIYKLKLERYFSITQKGITNFRGSEIFYKGMHHNVQEIKSTEDVDICWVEEAQAVSAESLRVLRPTIRNSGSEIWFSLNPLDEDDPVYKDFVVSPPPNAAVHKVNWDQNPWFTKELNDERLFMLATDPAAYDHVWGGMPRRIGDAVIFKNKFIVETFDDPPPNTMFYYGADWGFARDPTVLIRSYIEDDVLYVDHAVYGYGTEMEDIPALFGEVPGAHEWPIYADESRPETISYVGRRGFAISAADKWKGSVEDGIEYLRSFRRILIHPRCARFAEEARLYSYKVDKQTEKVLPLVEDKFNHGWDALRYAHYGRIQSHGIDRIWDRL